MFRRTYRGISGLMLALVLSASVPALASQKRNLTLHRDAVLLGTPLPAGQYTIRWESHSATATVTVSKKKQVLATAPAKLVQRDKTYDLNSIVLDAHADGTNTIREIRPAGSSHAIVFYE